MRHSKKIINVKVLGSNLRNVVHVVLSCLGDIGAILWFEFAIIFQKRFILKSIRCSSRTLQPENHLARSISLTFTEFPQGFPLNSPLEKIFLYREEF